MSKGLSKTEGELLLGLGVAAGIAFVLYKASSSNALNPTSSDNIINQGATTIYQDITGSVGTIGTDLYDFLHPHTAPASQPSQPSQDSDTTQPSDYVPII